MTIDHGNYLFQTCINEMFGLFCSVPWEHQRGPLTYIKDKSPPHTKISSNPCHSSHHTDNYQCIFDKKQKTDIHWQQVTITPTTHRPNPMPKRCNGTRHGRQPQNRHNHGCNHTHRHRQTFSLENEVDMIEPASWMQ